MNLAFTRQNCSQIADVETGKTLGPNQPGEFRIKCSHMFMVNVYQYNIT